MSKAKILVVEDKRIIQLDIQKRLKSLGYLVPEVASSGKEAIEKAKETQPDLVLMDIVLKGEMDGVTAAKYIHGQLDIPVIYLTAYSDEETLKRAKITEPFGYILKPFETRDLYITVEMALYKNQMERKLKESENWLSITLGSVGDAVIATDHKGNVKMLNTIAESLTGWKNADAEGKKIDEVFILKNEQTGKPVKNPINIVLKKGLVVGLGNHTLLITKEGNEIPIEDSAAPIKDEKGKIRGVVLIFRDDSRRRLAEKTLMASESFNRGLIESSPVGILNLDKEGRILYENPAMRKLMGVPEGMVSPVLGKRICDLEPIKASGAVPFLEDLLKGKPISGEVIRYHSLMGPVSDLEVHATPLKGEDGSITGAILNVKDISDQKKKELLLVESKEYIESIFQSITDPVAVIKVIDYTILDANKAFRDAYNLGMDDIGVKTCYQATHNLSTPCPFPEHGCPLEETVKTGKPVSVEHVHCDKSGNIEYYLISTSPLLNVHGEIERVVHIAKNITELKKSQVTEQRNEKRIEAQLYLFQNSHLPLDGICKYAVEQAISLTESQLGFIGFIDKNETTMHTYLWSEKAMNTCEVENRPVEFNVQEAGIWAEAVRQRKTILVNDYSSPDPLKKGIPAGHVSLSRFICIPVLRDGRVVMIGVFANKQEKYDTDDQKQLTLFLEGLLGIIQNKQSEENLRLSEEKFRDIFTWSPIGIYQSEENGRIINANQSFAKMLGYESTDNLIDKVSINDLYLNPETRKKLIDQYDKSGIGSARNLEIQWKKRDGTVIWIMMTAHAILDQIGRTRYYEGFVVDITEHKETEDKLQQSEEKYRTMIEQSNDMIWMLDTEGKLTYANERCEEVTGYKVSSFIGQSFTTLLLEDEMPAIADTVHRALKGESLHYEVHLRGLNDRLLLLSVNTAPIWSAGKIIGTVAFARDITEMRKAEEQLRTTRDYLENLLDSANAPIIVWDPDTIITRFNFSFEHLTGYSSKDVLGKKLGILFPESSRIKSMRKIELTLKGEFWESVEIPILCKNGETRIVLWNSANIYAEDKTTLNAVIAQGIDITERKKQEQIQKILYHISQAGISTDSFEVFIAEIQKQLSTIIDTTNFYIAFYDASADTISIPFMADQKDQFTVFPAANTMTKYMMLSKKPLLATKDDMLALHKSGHIEIHGTLSEIWLGVPLKSHEKVTGAVVVQSYENASAYGMPEMTMLEFISDQISISIERRKAEQEIKVALEKSQESDRLKSAFLATMSHELRTPLNSVIGFSQLIDMDTPKDEVLVMTQRIRKSGEHLLSIIEDMFDVTLIESGQVTMKEEEFMLLPFMESIHKMMIIEQAKANKETIDIEFNREPENRDFLLCTDKFKLGQILINLIRNSIKFTHKGRIDYGYILESHDEKPFLKFYVKDTGIGIPEKSHEIIFDIFRQVDDTHTRQYGGTGIGLSVAKKLTELLGGQIWLDSKEGVGSTFYFTIPYHGKETIQPAISPTVTPRKELNFSGKTILVAEDDDSNFEYLQYVLEKLQAKILRAKNGLEAIKFSESKPEVDLVLMDIKMPDMSGYEAAKQIKKTRSDLPIIAQTAYALYGDKEKSAEAGCDDYITKPIKKDALFKILEKYLIIN